MGNCWSLKKSKTHSENNCDKPNDDTRSSWQIADLPTEKNMQGKEENCRFHPLNTVGRSADTLRRTKSSIPAFSDRRSSKKQNNQVNKSNGSDSQSEQSSNSTCTETCGPVTDQKNSLQSDPALSVTCKSVKLHIDPNSASQVDSSVKCTKGSERTYQLRSGNCGRKLSFEKRHYIYE